MCAQSTKSSPQRYNRLNTIAISGGFLDGARIDFAAGLNCLIGARGTGKTTALEFIRYALDLLPEDGPARRRIESLVAQNLDGGCVQVGIETKEGLRYSVSRQTGEPPIVLDESGKATEITLKLSGGFFRAAVFSQNDVESIADSPNSQLDLLDTFEAEEIRQINSQLRQAESDLNTNAASIAPLHDEDERLSNELLTLPGIDEKLKALAARTGASAQAINQAHALKALRDREKRAVGNLAQSLDSFSQQLEGLAGQLGRQARTQLVKDVVEGPNGELFKSIGREMVDCGKEIDALLRQALERAKTTRQRLADDSRKLHTTHDQQELAFQQLLEKHKEAQSQSAERARLEKDRNELLARKQQRQEAQERLAALSAARAALLAKLSELRDRRFALRKAAAERITASLAPNIRVTVVQCGNREKYHALLSAALKDARLRYVQVAEKIVAALDPSGLVEAIKSKDQNVLIRSAGLNPDQAEKALAALSSPRLLMEIETVELVDHTKIELLDGGAYKDALSLSTGQKCTAILPILLLDSDQPLLVDQPEDNLDNGFIYETVVETIQKAKAKRQLIFITHNPNIPVLGDADRVFVLKSNGAAARVAKAGTVDQCKDDIVKLLEGGEEAFKRRKQRYKY
jgi:energy-coupling factor transporter ATP-binding protein EcfA2